MKTTIGGTIGTVSAMLAIGASVLLTGCNADTKLTSQEQANIKGNGQMPEEDRQKLASQLQQANQKMQQSKPGPASSR